jgi:hypothetical protein
MLIEVVVGAAVVADVVAISCDTLRRRQASSREGVSQVADTRLRLLHDGV